MPKMENQSFVESRVGVLVVAKQMLPASGQKSRLIPTGFLPIYKKCDSCNANRYLRVGSAADSNIPPLDHANL